MAFWLKLNTNLRQIVTSELPRLGGSWITAFFLVGLLVGFRNPAITRLRYFLLGCVAGADLRAGAGPNPAFRGIARDQLREPARAAGAAGVGLWRELVLPAAGPNAVCPSRNCATSSSASSAWSPACRWSLSSCRPRPIPVAYPPYYPPAIQTVAGWLKEKELAMSDIPWAVAWYGQRQCVWLTLKCTPGRQGPEHARGFLRH